MNRIKFILFIFYKYSIILGIQQENRHIRQLQHENKELRAALEEHQNAIELIMSKYRQHITCLMHSSKPDNNAINQQKSRVIRYKLLNAGILLI